MALPAWTPEHIAHLGRILRDARRERDSLPPREAALRAHRPGMSLEDREALIRRHRAEARAARDQAAA